MIQTGTVLILMAKDAWGRPEIIASLSDEPEVELVEAALADHHPDPLEVIREHRSRQEAEDEAFADYIETLLGAPDCRLDIQEHAARWFRSRLHLEQYRKAESEAREVIVAFAYRLFCEDTSQTDFILASANSEVRVMIRVVETAVDVRSA